MSLRFKHLSLGSDCYKKFVTNTDITEVKIPVTE